MITTLQITGECNLKCAFCLDEYKHTTHMTQNRFDEVLGYMKEAKVRNLMLTGGEPLLHPKINHIIEKLYEHKIKIRLNTNGLLLPRLSESAINRVDRILVSIDGNNEVVSEKMTRGRYSFGQVIKHLEAFKHHDKITVQTIISKKNQHSIHILGKELLRLGITHWHLRPFLPLGLGKELADEFSIDAFGYEQTLNKIRNSYPQLRLNTFQNDHQFSFIHITPNGEVLKIINDNEEKDEIK